MAKTPTAPKARRVSTPKTNEKVSKGILVRINVEGWRELRKLAAENDDTIQGVMIKEVNYYL